MATAASQPALGATLRNPLDSTGIPLRATLAPTGSALPANLHLAATIGVANLRFTSAHGQQVGAAVVVTIFQNVAGAPLNSSRHLLRWRLTKAQYQQRLRDGIQFEQEVQPAAGAVTLRLVVQDANSRAIGSLIMPLHPAPLHPAPLHPAPSHPAPSSPAH